MRTSLFTVLGTAAALGAALLSTTAASAAPQARAAPATCTPGLGTPSVTGSCTTTVTFTVTSGTLSITAPDTAGLSAAVPGAIATGAVGPVVVTDNRAALDAAWTASASSTDFTHTTIAGAAAIPVGDATYTPGAITITPTGAPVIATPATITLSATPAAPVVTNAGVGNSVATWDPTIAVAVPAAAVGGGYTSVLTQSVA